MKINHGMMPPNGPHFPVDRGVELKAGTFESLYRQIASYRMVHGIDPGDPERDVNDYFCAKWPHVCQPEPGDGPKPEHANKPVGGRVVAWAAGLSRQQPQGGFALVDDKTALERATICSRCPYNKQWRTNCAPCWSAAETLLANLRRLRNVPLDLHVVGCEICGHENRTAALMPDDVVRPTEEIRKRLPPACWLKKLNPIEK